jgi:DHA2 family multidrug resistance protein
MQEGLNLKDFLSPLKKKIITFFLMISTVIVVLDMTIANVALSSISGNLGATSEQSSWILTSYVIAETISMLVTSWFVGKFSSKNFFLFCVTGFTVTSMLCGLSLSLTQIVAFRFIQGLFGAAIIPISQSVLIDMNSVEERGKAMAVWGMGIMLGPILGPTLGGYITEYYNWRFIFFINLPFGIASVIGIYAFLPKMKSFAKKFDFIGFFLFGTAVCSLQLFLDRGEQQDWLKSNEIRVYLALCISFLLFFILYIIFSKKKHLIVNIEMFKNKNYNIGAIFSFFIGLILFSSIAVIPPFLQGVIGYSILDTGFLLAPRGFGVIIAMIIYSKICNKIDQRMAMAFGFATIGFSLFLLTFCNENSPKIQILIPTIIQGGGIGFCFSPLSSIAFLTLNPAIRAEATSIFSLIRNIGSSIGISVVIFLANHFTKMNYIGLTENITINSNGFNFYKDYLSDRFSGESIDMIIIQQQIYQQAAVISFINIFRLMMFLCFFLVPFIFIVKKIKIDGMGPSNNEISH